MTPRAALFDKSETAVRISLCASHRLPTVVRHFLERRAVAIALRRLRRLRARSGAYFVEQLTDKTERVNLIVVPAGRETQQLGPQVRQPWCALPHIEAEHRHAAAHELRAHGLVCAARELLAGCVGGALDCATLQERESGDRFNQCTTPAMAVGVTDRLWGICDIVTVLENWESQS